MRPRLLIIGGGYVGSAVARRLDRHLDVTLIEPKQAFIHTPAMIRALVQPGLIDRALIPYDRLLQRGRVIRGRADRIGADQVRLVSGETVSGDLVLVATGSSHAGFLKPNGDSIDDFRTAHSNAAARIQAARHIAIIGAGPAGIELAGEIAFAHPGKTVTLLSPLAGLLPDYPDKFGQKLARKLAGLGVSLRQGRARLDHDDRPCDGPLMLDSGEVIDADLILPATGSRPRGHLLADLPGLRLTGRGQVVTDGWLRPSDHPRLFIGGDIAATGDAMSIVATLRQIPFLEATLRGVANGEYLQHRSPYRPWAKPPILLPLGPRIGASLLPFPGPLAPFGVMGNAVTRQMKGRDLFLAKQYRDMGWR